MVTSSSQSKMNTLNSDINSFIPLRKFYGLSRRDLLHRQTRPRINDKNLNFGTTPSVAVAFATAWARISLTVSAIVALAPMHAPPYSIAGTKSIVPEEDVL